MNLSRARSLININKNHASVDTNNNAQGIFVVKFGSDKARRIFAFIQCVEKIIERQSAYDIEDYINLYEYSRSDENAHHIAERMYGDIIKMSKMDYGIALPKDYHNLNLEMIEGAFLGHGEVIADNLYADAFTSLLRPISDVLLTGGDRKPFICYDDSYSLDNIRNSARFIIWSKTINGTKQYSSWDCEKDGGAFTTVGLVEMLLLRGQLIYYAY